MTTAGPARVKARALPRLDRAPARLSANQLTGRRQAAARGWTGQQWDCLRTLWNHESQWNHLAQNPTSSARGIAQFIDGTWKDYGPKTDNPEIQVRYGLSYINDRYGSPCAAWIHWSSRKPLRGKDVGHWY
jgi:hypothetical protein